MIGIYKITSPTRKIYIGQSVNIKRRFESYLRCDCKGQTKIYNSLKKYGSDRHTFEVITLCDISDLNEKEAYYIKLYNSNKSNGLNCNVPRYLNNAGYLSEETKIKMSLAQTGNTKWLGKKHTEETKLKMSLSAKKKPKSKETCLKISLAKKGINPKHWVETHPSAKIVLNTSNGIFYKSLKEASLSYNFNYNTLKSYLNGDIYVNKSDLIYV